MLIQPQPFTTLTTLSQIYPTHLHTLSHQPHMQHRYLGEPHTHQLLHLISRRLLARPLKLKVLLNVSEHIIQNSLIVAETVLRGLDQTL
jgi:hypothetical protein